MEIHEAYNEWAERYDSNANLTRDLDAEVTRKVFANQRFHNLLELGCGTGKNTIFYAEIASQVHALDFSVGMIEKARARAARPNVRFEAGDLNQPWPCEDSFYNLAACNLVLEHIQNLEHIFSEAARVLTPGGKFFINELHPFKQYGGTRARFEHCGQVIEVTAFTHNISEFTNTARNHKFNLACFNEYWHAEDEGRPPRLVSFLFAKAGR